MPVRRVSHSSAHCIVSSYSQSPNHDNSHWEAVPQTPEPDVAIYPRHGLSSTFPRYGNTAVSMASLTTLEDCLSTHVFGRCLVSRPSRLGSSQRMLSKSLKECSHTSRMGHNCSSNASDITTKECNPGLLQRVVMLFRLP